MAAGAGKLNPAGRTVFLGLDLGTSACRALALDERQQVLASAASPLPEPERDGPRAQQDPGLWWRSVCDCLTRISASLRKDDVCRLAVDGTSGTLLLCEHNGIPRTPALMYSDGRALEQAKRIAKVAPAECGAHGPWSGLAHYLWLREQSAHHRELLALHQADWIAGRLCGRFGDSDYNNALKLGYDPVRECWPDWLVELEVERERLPRVQAPGSELAPVDPALAKELGLPPQITVVSGTTDSVAAFVAAGAERPGEAVTALGSTLALKMISTQAVFAPGYGVYSHRLGRYWLAGGASNSGGAVLLQHFSQRQLDQMTPRLDPERPTGLDYYPLPRAGERFPVNDPQLAPRMEPVPTDPVAFFQGLLEGIAAIERAGYRRLTDLGAPALRSVRSTGGGSRNPAWTRIRERLLGVPLLPAVSQESAYGAARIAAGIVQTKLQ
jgi:sugar (pentulose or hexulose) kinase